MVGFKFKKSQLLLMYSLIDTISFFEKYRNKSKEKIEKILHNCFDKTPEQIQIYLWNNYKNTILEDKYVDFLTIVKDGEFYYKNVFPKIYKDICENLNARFFIYENNSTDNTKELLHKLASENENIIVKTETLNHDNKNRIQKITFARNRLSVFYKEYINKNKVGGNWLFLYDTDILFNYEVSVKPLIEKTLLNSKCLMFLTYSVFAGYNKHMVNIIRKKKIIAEELEYLKYMLYYYYDTLALEYGKYYSLNSFEFFTNKNIRVNTAFGGLGIINTIYYLTSYYDIIDVPKNIEKNQLLEEDGLHCEHWSYGQRLNNFGYMYITMDSNSLWYQDIDFINDEFYDYVFFFIKNKNLKNLL